MDSEKLGSSCSESSSELEEQSEAIKEDDYSDNFTNIKRSYECIFCKRGFTNAQALGGHMNIHRKDRPNKPPKIASFSSSSLQSNQPIGSNTFSNIPFFGPPLGMSQVNYQPSPSIPHAYFQQLGDFNMNLWGSDLSLQIGPTKGRRQLWNGDGVDLELRLGNHP